MFIFPPENLDVIATVVVWEPVLALLAVMVKIDSLLTVKKLD
jgi:hypothetical protein